MNKQSVAILGSGPAALFAAHAANLEDAEVVILTADPYTPSTIVGAQYIHAPVPWVTKDEPDFEVQFLKLGYERIYASKTRFNGNAKTSWRRFEHKKKYPAWDMRRAYGELFERFHERMSPWSFGESEMGVILGEFDAVFSTIPRMVTCRGLRSCEFTEHTSYIAQIGSTLIPKNTVVYSGLASTSWHRASNINGFTSVERNVPFKDHLNQREIKEPISTTCRCWPGVHYIGRYGKWDGSFLAEHAHDYVRSHLALQ